MKINFFPELDGNKSFFDLVNSDLIKNESGELYVVVIEAQTAGHLRSDFFGFDFALTLEVEFPVILCSFLNEIQLSKIGFAEKLLAILSRKKTGFLRLPFSSEELLLKYHELMNEEREEDVLAVEINRIHNHQRAMAVIQHKAAFCIGKHDDRSKSIVASAVIDARDYGLTGTDEEIIQQIEEFEVKPMNSFFAGQFFPGVFADIEGTLLKEGEIDEKILQKIKDAAGKKPVTLWTGGDIKSLTETILSHGITWKIVSKYDFAGAEVEIAYDDETHEVFLGKYGVKVREYHQI